MNYIAENKEDFIGLIAEEYESRFRRARAFDIDLAISTYLKTDYRKHSDNELILLFGSLDRFDELRNEWITNHRAEYFEYVKNTIFDAIYAIKRLAKIRIYEGYDTDDMDEIAKNVIDSVLDCD